MPRFARSLRRPGLLAADFAPAFATPWAAAWAAAWAPACVTAMAIGLALAASAAPAAAMEPIDDFEKGEFDLRVIADCETEIVTINAPGHAIYYQRTVTLCSPGNVLGQAHLFPGRQLDDEVVYQPQSSVGGFLKFTYDWGFPGDLTIGGTADRIEIDMPEIVTGGQISVVIFDASGSQYITKMPTAPGITSINLSSFSNVDYRHATRMEIGFTCLGHAGEFRIADMRLRTPRSIAVDYIGDYVAVETPPIPTPPLSFRVLDDLGHPLYRADIPILDAHSIVGVSRTRGEWQKTAGLGGEIAGMEFSWLSADYLETYFELMVKLSPANGFTPTFFPPDPVMGEEGFLLAFPAMLTDQAGNEVGQSAVRLLFDIGEGQALQFADVRVESDGGAGADVVDAFRVSFRLVRFGVVDLTAPLFEAGWVSDWAPSVPAGVDPPGLGAGLGAALIASPSIARPTTELRLRTTAAEPRLVEIHDVAGRRVRALTVPAGARSVSWDGTDDAGNARPSGLYFARLTGSPATTEGAPEPPGDGLSLVARITLLR